MSLARNRTGFGDSHSCGGDRLYSAGNPARGLSGAIMLQRGGRGKCNYDKRIPGRVHLVHPGRARLSVQ